MSNKMPTVYTGQLRPNSGSNYEPLPVVLLQSPANWLGEEPTVDEERSNTFEGPTPTWLESETASGKVTGTSHESRHTTSESPLFRSVLDCGVRNTPTQLGIWGTSFFAHPFVSGPAAKSGVEESMTLRGSYSADAVVRGLLQPDIEGSQHTRGSSSMREPHLGFNRAVVNICSSPAGSSRGGSEAEDSQSVLSGGLRVPTSMTVCRGQPALPPKNNLGEDYSRWTADELEKALRFRLFQVLKRRGGEVPVCDLVNEESSLRSLGGEFAEKTQASTRKGKMLRSIQETCGDFSIFVKGDRGAQSIRLKPGALEPPQK
jgi:hypothetical protein